MKARDIMKTEHLCTCPPETDCRQAAQLMTQYDTGCLPVLDTSGCVQGVVTDRDLVIRLIAQGQSPETPVSQIMTKPVHSVTPDADLKDIEAIMQTYRIRRVLVIDAENRLQGVISLANLTHCIHGLLKEHRLVETLETVTSPA